MDSIINDEGWLLSEAENPLGDREPMPTHIVPYITDPAAWEQYHNEMVYETDKMLRNWIKTMSENKTWVREARKRKYTFGMIFEILFGRPFDSREDMKKVCSMTRVIAYYSSRIQKQGYIDGKCHSKTVYTISPKRLDRLPYSLKLRIEEMNKRGEFPNGYNMKLPNDNLKPGHARNRRTDANMARRREEGRRQYNERYKDRAH